MNDTVNIPYDKFFQQLWDLAKSLLQVIGKVWDWLTTDLKLSIPFLEGKGFRIGPWNLGFTTIDWSFDLGKMFSFNLGYTPLQLLGVGLLVLIGLWVIKKLIPLG